MDGKYISGSNVLLAVDVANLNPANQNNVEIIGGSTSCTFNFTQEAIDTTNKDSGGYKSFINGVKTFTLDCDAFTTVGSGAYMGEGVRPYTIHDMMSQGSRIAVKWYTDTGATAAKKYQGFGYITSLSVNGSVGEWSTYSISIQGDGDLAVTNV
tara:strand:- start:28 stop:489 length:462 start_codon:yes stop_codon:yes gene_type:complete